MNARARRAGEAAVSSAVVEARTPAHALVLRERGDERRVVVHAQVAAEPDDRGGRAAIRRCVRAPARRAQPRMRRCGGVRDFPLFPLGIVALPDEVVPAAHLRGALQDDGGECLDHESEFGIVWAVEDGLRDDRLRDARSPRSSSARGRPAEHPHARHAAVPAAGGEDDLPYPAGDVEFLADKPEEPDERDASRPRTTPTPSSSSRRPTAARGRGARAR